MVHKLRRGGKWLVIEIDSSNHEKLFGRFSTEVEADKMLKAIVDDSKVAEVKKSSRTKPRGVKRPHK